MDSFPWEHFIGAKYTQAPSNVFGVGAHNVTRWAEMRRWSLYTTKIRLEKSMGAKTRNPPTRQIYEHYRVWAHGSPLTQCTRNLYRLCVTLGQSIYHGHPESSRRRLYMSGQVTFFTQRIHYILDESLNRYGASDLRKRINLVQLYLRNRRRREVGKRLARDTRGGLFRSRYMGTQNTLRRSQARTRSAAPRTGLKSPGEQSAQ